ncbi:MAG: Tryptophan synthase alpha chain [Myxococcaceae bacterium]|nr:Tryptophan synthase alpha chain [Myxococcaceae bacterium]
MVRPQRRVAHWLGAALGSCVLAACSQSEISLTQLILVADTDIAGIDSIRFAVSGADSANIEDATATRSIGSGPSYVSIVRGDGALGPLTVTASALSNTQVKLVRTHVVSFVPHQTRVVVLHLYASCLAPPVPQCDPIAQTCAASGCVPQLLLDNERDLPGWTGTPPRLSPVELQDGGSLDGGAPLADGGARPDADAAVPTDASTRDAQTRDAQASDAQASDAQITDAQAGDAGQPVFMSCGAAGLVDTQTSVAHCGGCDTPCAAVPAMFHAVASCMSGACAYSCMVDWGDCDLKPSNGCEGDLTMPDRCGSCTHRCNKGEMCMAGTCI